MKFFVYGEDGLTLKFLKENLQEVLDKLGDNSDKDCTVFYRPSLGRTKYFGEFDAILITSDYTYLIESKWDWSSDLRQGLKDHQIRRHRILAWLKENWESKKWENWDEFVKEKNEDFKKCFKYEMEKEGQLETRWKYLPSEHDVSGRPTKLARNLQTILGKIQGKKLIDVLLVFYENEEIGIKQEGFKIVQMKYKPTQDLFIELR